METKVVHTHTGKIYFNPLKGKQYQSRFLRAYQED